MTPAAEGGSVRRMTQSATKRAGFTLFEMLTVLTIIAIVAGTVIARVNRQREKANQSRTKILLSELESEIENYRLEEKAYPERIEDLATKGYLDERPVDAWGRAIEFRLIDPEQTPAYRITSFGRDGQPGGEGLDADLTAPR